ncbi:MAG TPA: class I SAM-dependent methyltransferase [Steroidobacteraceae bacterium]|jgi:2-polyprenyl-3-methyl-5-hydroxy-6-metoxy-1,4-benzoquinol methylase|nr:class I SAM-dependent methyltransferase [Steroidobacteraceae bacterium]
MTDELVSLQRTLYESRNPTRRWLHNSRRDWIVKEIQKHSCSGGKALEIGPGSGVYVPTLLNNFADIYLADCEPVYLSAIGARYSDDSRVTTVVDDITHSALPSDFFDLILCTEVIEHIADSPAALQNIARILKPDGVLVLSTPQRYSSLEVVAKVALSPWLIWLTRLAYREPVLELGHINLMTEHELRRQLAAANFRVMDHAKGGLYLPGLAEVGGKFAQTLSANLEKKMRDSFLEWVLWTQYYVVKRVTPD